MIMKRIQFAIVGLVSLVVTSAMTSCSCNTHAVFTGKMVSQNRHINGFDEIEVNGSPTVYYAQSDSFSVKVKGPEDAVENIITEKEGNSLVIRNKGKFGVVNFQLGGDEELAVYVTSPDIVAVRLNGSGDFVSEKKVDTDNMAITLRGSGDISFDDLLCDRCKVDLIGSGDITLDHSFCEGLRRHQGRVRQGMWRCGLRSEWLRRHQPAGKGRSLPPVETWFGRYRYR